MQPPPSPVPAPAQRVHGGRGAPAVPGTALRSSHALGLAVLLGIATVAVYWTALSGEFVYDDLLLVGRNAHIADLESVLAAFAQPYWAFDDPEPGPLVGFWRPLTMAVLALGRWLGGGAPGALHAFSLALHILASLICWRLIRRLTGRPLVAYLAAFAFALHPVHVESVAWISAINDPLYTVFALLALDAFARWRLAGSAGFPLASGLWLFPALLAKEQALAVLPAALALDVALARRAERRRGDWKRAYAPLALAGAAYVLLRMGVFGSLAAGFDQRAAGFALGWKRSASYWVELYGGFLSLLAWPLDLAVFRQVRPQISLGDRHLVVAAGALVLWSAALALAWRTRRRAAVAALLFLPASLAPVLLSFESAGAFPLSDRYLYLSVAGWSAILVVASTRWLGERAGAALVLLILVGYGVRASAQTRIYQSDEAFFRAAAASSPRTPYVHWGLGRVLLQRYQVELDKPLLDEALLHFLTSLYLGTDYGPRSAQLPADAPLRDRVSELNAVVNDTPANLRKPDPTVMHSISDREQANIGLGWCYLFLADLPGERDLATPLHIFEQTTRLFPNSYRALTGLGAAHLKRGEIDEAIATFRRALEIHPGHAEAWHNLGQAHVKRQAWDEARGAFEQALERRPGHMPDLVGIATTAIEAGRFDLAEATLAGLRAAHPESLEPLFWSGMLAARQRDFRRALNWFDAVLAREASHGFAQLERGKVLLQMGEALEATKALGRACELIPDSFEAHYNLGAFQLERSGAEAAEGYLIRAFELSPPGELRDSLHYNLRAMLRGDGSRAYHLADVSQARAEHAQAHDWLSDAIAAGEPWASSADVHYRRGSALRMKGESAEAVGAYKRSLELDDAPFWPQHDLGMLLAEMGRHPEAVPYLEAARERIDQLADHPARAAVAEAVERAIAGTMDFTGPTQIPIPAQDADASWR